VAPGWPATSRRADAGETAVSLRRWRPAHSIGARSSRAGVAAVCFLLYFGAWVLGGKHVAGFEEYLLAQAEAGASLFFAF
jgi:hypothetical protein